jgi:carbonic anhydrase
MMSPPRMSRREFVSMAVGASVALPGTCAGADLEPVQPHAAPANPDAALRQLLDGNERFIKGKLSHPGRAPSDFIALAEEQRPLSVILGCADSRVPPEVLFDQGVGDLFVVRVAGNAVGGTGAVVKGSIEFAIAELMVPLIVVLGHSNCGAVKAAIKHVEGDDKLPGAINDLVTLIRPAVAQVHTRPGDKLDLAIRANVMLGVDRLMTLEPILAKPVKDGRVKVVGAVYDLRSGRVELLK